MSYGELRRQVTELRAALLDAGVRPRGVVALALPSGPEFLAVFLAASRIGACAPLDPALTEPECRSLLSRLGAQAIICSEGPAAMASTALGIRVLAVRPASSGVSGAFTLDPIAGTTSALPARETDAALLLHTSATTAAPKLVPLSRDNLRALAAADARALELTQADRFLALMPMFHLHGLSAALTQLSVGGTVIATGGFAPAEFPEWLAEFRPTWFSASPAIHRVLLALVRERPDAFRAAPLRFIRSTGAGFDAAVLAALEEATGVPVLEGYGLSEAGGVARCTLRARRPGSVGRASGVEIAILDDGGAPLGAGMQGEIAVRGPSVVSGYVDDPAATEAAFHGGWFHTGDSGHLDADGFLFLRGRIKEMINRGGEKVAPEEVDRVLAAHPAVADAVACAVPHRTLGEEVAAAVVRRAGCELTELELRRFAATRLAPFKVPRRIGFLEKIPRGPTGKPRRSAAAAILAGCCERREASAGAPADPAHERIAGIWSGLLGAGDFHPDDDFFSAGGDSLTAAIMLGQVCRAFGVDAGSLPALDFFEQPSIARLAELLRAAQPGPAGDCIALRTGGARTPLFCFPASTLAPYYLRHLAGGLGDSRPFYAVCPPVAGDALVPIEEAARLAVTAIQRVRRTGPYLLCGHCYGGVVAFEAARQLMLARERVRCLVLFDTPTPGYPKLRRSWRRYAAQGGELISALAHGRVPIAAAEAAAHLRAVRRFVGRRLAGRVAQAVPAAALPVHDPQALNGLAMRGYRPRDLLTPIVHCLPGDHPASTRVLEDPRLGWRDFARAGFDVVTVPGDHGSMFEPPRAAVLAARLGPFLDSFDE